MNELRGRRYEREALDRLVAGVRAGRGQVLVLRGADPRQCVASALAGVPRSVTSEAALEDYLISCQGNRFASAVRYVRAYPADLPVLAGLLPRIRTPVRIIAGAHDTAVPSANAEFLAQRLPRSTLDIIDAGHFAWEDAADEYAALVTRWWTADHHHLS